MKRKVILKLGGFSCVIGIITGLIIALFLICLEKATYLNQHYNWLIFILPFSGGIMTYIYKRFGKNAHKGNNIIIENINGSNEKIHFIMAPLVFIGTILAHLFGASVGREGTGVQIGGTIGSFISDKIKLKGLEKRILLISGVSAGFSSVFGTPLAGTLFALEVARIGNLTYEAFLPSIIAALAGDWVVKYIGVKHTHFVIPQSESFTGSIIIKVIIMAICFGIVSRLFSLFTYWFKELLSKYFKKSYIKTIVGGTLMVVATLFIGNRVYNGLSLTLLGDAFKGDISYYSFFIKLILTTLCLGAGYQGGEVTPLFVIGATLGCTLGTFLGLPVAFSASLGLVAVFAGATKTPIASFMMGNKTVITNLKKTILCIEV